jgi:hypothetical protein
MLVLLNKKAYGVWRLDGFIWYDGHAEFHED